MNWKALAKKLLFPPLWLIVVLTLVSAAALCLVFLKGMEQTPVAYVSYAVAFYTLCVLSVYCALVLPRRWGAFRQRLEANPFVNRYLTDRAFHERCSMYLSLIMNLLLAGVNVLSWYLGRSWWFVVLAGYYGMLSLLWVLLAAPARRAWKRARLCAWLLLTVNLFLSGAVLMILYQNKGFHYNGILIYVMALFTFYNTAHAIIALCRRGDPGPIRSAAGIVSLSAALVSMLALETAMFSQFGADMAQDDQNLMVILTGAGISLTVITLSVLLIVKATKNIRREKHGNQ